MPSWLMQTAGWYSQSDGLLLYHTPCAAVMNPFGIFEEHKACLARDSYTWDRLYVYINTNTLDDTTTIRSRKSGANGNQSVSIGAGTTGTFEDNVNSDSLVSGDYFSWQCDTSVSTSGAIDVRIFASRLTTASNTTPIIGHNSDQNLDAGQTWYAALGGFMWDSSESKTQRTFRTISTLSNFRVTVSSNGSDGVSTFTVRVNGANGNQSVSVGAGATGVFEDAVNTDNIAVGDEVNYQAVIGGTSGNVLHQTSCIKSNSSVREVMWSRGPSGYWASAGAFERVSVEGGAYGAAAMLQSKCRTNLGTKNAFVNIPTNTCDDVSTITLQKNGANTSLSVSVPAATTGFFEDLVNTVGFLSDDLIYWEIDATASGAGSIWFTVISFEQEQYTPAPPGAPPSGAMASKLIAERII